MPVSEKVLFAINTFRLAMGAQGTGLMTSYLDSCFKFIGFPSTAYYYLHFA